MNAVQKLLDKLDEKSTWVGVAGFVVSVFNLDVSQAIIEQGSVAASALVSVGLMVLTEDKSGK
jgi:hypothetical protein